MSKLVVRIAEGLGNQLFMYSFGLSLAKEFNYHLLIDNSSAFFKKKNHGCTFNLDKFNISSDYADSKLKFDNYYFDFIRKINKKFDIIRHKKSFLIEPTNNKKISYFNKIDLSKYADELFIEGYFQSEKYFVNYKNDLIKEFKIKNKYIYLDNYLINYLKKSNSVSIHIRQNRFSEGKTKNDEKSLKFTIDTINYIKRAVLFAKQKIDKPQFFIWSNDFKGLSEYFNPNEFFFVNDYYLPEISGADGKLLNDFNLFKYSKHFIVGPTTFHWWGAWLNENPDKICIRPSNINPSNNIDFWPDSWISI